MKGALQILRYENRFNRWLLPVCWLVTVVGAYLDNPMVAAMAAASTGILSSGSIFALEQGGNWEMLVMTMPVSRKALILGRYAKSLLYDLIPGVVYMMAFPVFHGNGDDGCALLLAGYAMVATACSIPISYTSWSMEAKQRGYSFCISSSIIFSRMVTRTDYEAIQVAGGWTAVPLPISMEQGLNWLTAGLILMAVSILLSLWLEPRREW